MGLQKNWTQLKWQQQLSDKGARILRWTLWDSCAIMYYCLPFVAVQSPSTVDSLPPHELQHSRRPCPSPTPRVSPSSYSLHWWCHPVISSSDTVFSCPLSFPASGNFPKSQLFVPGAFSLVWIKPLNIIGYHSCDYITLHMEEKYGDYNLGYQWVCFALIHEDTEIKLPTSVGSSKKQESSRKTSISALLTTPRPLTLWITKNYGKFLKDGNTRPADLPLEKSVCRSRSNS